MEEIRLNEHDANQGAQSSGEFLGMSGNSGWYLLGSAGASILMVILLWGILGWSLLMCLFVGLVLCLGSVVYVFTLKNNKPEHYDTDFFETALVEAGIVSFRFSPRNRPLRNPFTGDGMAVPVDPRVAKLPARSKMPVPARAKPEQKTSGSETQRDDSKSAPKRPDPAPVIEELQEELETAEELLEEALAKGE